MTLCDGHMGKSWYFHINDKDLDKAGVHFLFFIRTMFFLAQPGKRDRDNYRQLTTMFLNFELI